MRKAYKNRFFSLLIGFSLILSVASCVDLSVENIPQGFNFLSQLKFVNLVPGGGTATITLDGTQIGTADPGNETPAAGQPFREVPAGSKELNVDYSNGGSDQFNIVTDTDYKMRIYIVGDSSGNSVAKSLQRYIWQTKGSSSGQSLFPSNMTQIALFNASPDVTIDEISIHRVSDNTDTTITFEEPVAYKSGVPYIKIPATATADYQLFVIQGGDTLATISVSAAAPQNRYTAVIYDYSSDLKNSVFLDD
jgi:hypothetical protein